MNSQWCGIANHPAALNQSSKDSFHARCPGAYAFDGKVELCECECHGQEERELVEVLKGVDRVPPAFPVLAGVPRPAEKDRPRPRTGATGRCEHCGAPTGGRFAPGHDAKLKSELTSASVRGDYRACAELILRKWPRHPAIDPAVLARAEEFAAHHGQSLVERRSAVRQSSGGNPRSS